MSRPSIVQVLDAFIHAEESLGLFELSARGKQYWPWIRNSVFSAAQQAHRLLAKPHASWTDRPWREFVKPLTRDPASLLRRLSWRDLDPRELLVFNHNRQIRTERGFVCPYTNPHLEASSLRRWVMQASNNGVMAAPPAEEATRYLEMPTAVHGALSMLRPATHRLQRGERDEIHDWCASLSRELDVKLPVDTMVREAQTAVHEYVVRRAFYPRLLDKVRPRAVVIVVHYSRRCIAMTELARESGIPVVEVQHGLLGPTHLAYNYAPGRCPPMFPDYLLSFGQFWRDITPGFPLPPERCIPVGFPWLDQQRKAHAPESTADVSDTDRPRELLVLSQGAVGEALSRLALEAHALLDPRRWRVRYRLHPGELIGWKKRYPWLVGSGLEIDEAHGSVYTAFAKADAQLGVYSTAVYEGVSDGLRTLVAKLPGWEGAKPLVDYGAATLVEDGAAIARALTSEEQGRDLRHDLWADHPGERFEQAMAQIMESGTCR